MSQSPVLDTAQLEQLRTCGYVSLNVEKLAALLKSFGAMFEVSKEYFALDNEDQSKRRFRAPSGPGASEEGFSIIPSEKQIFTCKSYPRTPTLMNDRAKSVWEQTGAMLQEVMSMISNDLGLSGNPYEPLLGQCLKFENQRTPTLLRLFRYDRPQHEIREASVDTTSESSRIVAEAHKDLGLLSIVVGSSPGLEVYNEYTGKWISIEERSPTQEATSGLTITLLSGQVLRYLSRGVYRAGVHRVRCSSLTGSGGLSEPFRYSIVYALRPFPAPLNLSDFESTKVGVFTEAEKAGIDGQSAQILFNRLCSQHWNVNIGQALREQQRQSTSAQKMIQSGVSNSPQAIPSRLQVITQGDSLVASSKSAQPKANTQGKQMGRWARLRKQVLQPFTMSNKHSKHATASA